MSGKQRCILAVASGGGHWVQLLRLRPAFEGHKVVYVTTNPGYRDDVDAKLYAVTDANMWQKLKLMKMFAEVAWVVIKVRPDVVVTTGAAPGFAAILFARLLGAKTLWIDSIANSEELSNSGKKVKPFTTAWVTQWPHLAKSDGPEHWGAVL
jgi:UDP-N-acetylglucosamine:LPS N-acetylglucosamine transferase